MFKKTLNRYKPGAPRHMHLLLAALLWSCVGVMLLSRGITRMNPWEDWWVILLAIVIGGCKSRFILDKTAIKGIRRILDFSDTTCIGAVYSFKTWLLVLVMIGSGVMLRSFDLPDVLLVFVYFTVGTALLGSSRHAWSAWEKLINQKK